MSAPLWVAQTHHTAHMIERAAGEAVLLDDCNADRIKGRALIVAPSAAKPNGEKLVVRKLRALGATSVSIVGNLPGGALDLADLIETEDANGRDVDLSDIAAHAVKINEPAQRNRSAEGETSVRLIRGNELSPEPIKWLWRDFLARGKLHMIAGAPGAGKTTIAMALAATVTAGGCWPDGTRAEPGNVLIWSGEDDPGDTLLPRLLVQGADRSRIYFVGDVLADGKARPFDPARDMQALEREAARIGDVCLLIVDPIVNAVAGDSHKNTETRRALQPIVNLAARLGAAALGISHFSKNTAGRDPVERVTGSVAFGALPRIIFGAAKSTDGEGQTRRLFVRAKSNIGPDGGGFGYDLRQEALSCFPGVFASRALWGKPLDGTARDLLAVAETTEDHGERTEIAEAGDWLRGALADGPVEAREVKRLSEAQGFNWRTVHRAKERIGARSRREGFGKGSRVLWRLLIDDKNPIGDIQKEVSYMGAVVTYGESEAF